MSERFLYSVHPKRVIKNVPGVSVIRTPKSLYLNKEDVKICLKGGSVYRRFANEARNEKVTISNIDRLHNAKFMTEEEYKKFLESEIDSKRGTVINDKEDEPKVVVEETTEEVVENSEEKVEELETVEVEEESTVNDEVVEETTEEVVENSEEKVEEPKNYNNQKNYGGKNKHRH